MTLPQTVNSVLFIVFQSGIPLPQNLWFVRPRDIIPSPRNLHQLLVLDVLFALFYVDKTMTNNIGISASISKPKKRDKVCNKYYWSPYTKSKGSFVKKLYNDSLFRQRTCKVEDQTKWGLVYRYEVIKLGPTDTVLFPLHGCMAVYSIPQFWFMFPPPPFRS